MALNLRDLLVIDPKDEREIHDALEYVLGFTKSFAGKPDFEKMRSLDSLKYELNVRIYGAFPED